MPSPPKAPPPRPLPLDPPMVPIAVGGMVVWAVVGLVLLAIGGPRDWLHICLAGFLLGLPGLAVMVRHDANRRARQRAGDPAPP